MYCVYTATSCMKNVVKFTHKIGKTFGLLTYEENINIIKHVFNFIKSSKRFLVV